VNAAQSDAYATAGHPGSGRKLRILVVIGSLSAKHGGPSKMCLEMAQALADLGHKVDIFTTDQDGVDARVDVPLGVPIARGRVNVYYFHANSLKLWPNASFSLARALKKRVSDYDVVHSHSLYLYHGLTVSRLCRKMGIPYIIRPCGALDPVVRRHHPLRKAIFERLFERRNFEHAAAIHYTAQAEMDDAARVIPNHKGVVVPLGLNLAEYEPPAEPNLIYDAFPVLRNKRLILFLGRLVAKKGLDVAIPAFGKTAAEFPDAHLVIAGPDSDGFGANIRRWVSECGLGDRVLFTGMLEGQFKLAAFHAAEFFILPSYGENFGVAVVEAMACGLPVVVSKYLAIWRELERGGAALVTDTNPVEFAAAMRTLLANDAKRRTMGTKAKALAKALYSWPTVILDLEKLYWSLIAPSVGADPLQTETCLPAGLLDSK
jgi:glycosyltransferase involved in cell wall biosynthesis